MKYGILGLTADMGLIQLENETLKDRFKFYCAAFKKISESYDALIFITVSY